MKVLFFAQIREDLKTSELEIEDDIKTVKQLRSLLQEKGDRWQDLLSSERSLVAVNQTLCDDEFSLNANDEVAFFPPVTGG